MDWTFLPDNQGIMAIIARQVEGRYRVVHDALVPYVGLGPEDAQAVVKVHDGPGLRLQGGGTRILSGVTDSMTFAVMLDRPGGDELWEVGPDAQTSVRVVPPRRVRRPPWKPQAVPTGLMAPLAPAVIDGPAPEPIPVEVSWLVELCRTEAIHATVGDYVVIPSDSVPPDVPLPRWVVRSPAVDQVHVVKPRLGEDRVIGGGTAAGE